MGEKFDEKIKEAKSIGDSILDYEIFELRALKDAEEASAGKDAAFSRKINWLKKRTEAIKKDENDDIEENEKFEKEYSRWEATDFKELIRRLKKEGIVE